MPKASRNVVTVTAPTVGGHCVLTAQVTIAGKQQGQRSAYTAVVKDVENTKIGAVNSNRCVQLAQGHSGCGMRGRVAIKAERLDCRS